MIDYLISLKEQYKKYKEAENKLKEFIKQNYSGTIDHIEFENDNIVNLYCTEYCLGEYFREEYNVPFEAFSDGDTFKNFLRNC